MRLWVGLLLCAAPVLSEEPEYIDVSIETRWEWRQLPKKQLLPGSRSAVLIRRAVNPATGEPSDTAAIDARGLVRGFRLERTTYLLGEPLLVEFRVEQSGDDVWQEHVGGNYRGLGRDDNFSFRLRHEDGTWVDDPYPQPVLGGGISGGHAVRAGKPYSHWLAVQRYAALERPGKYELFCFHAHTGEVVGWRKALAATIPERLRAKYRLAEHGNRLVEIATGKPSRYRLNPRLRDRPSPSPLALPAELKRPHAMDYARFEIVVRAPTPAERVRFVRAWSKQALRGSGRNMVTGRGHAASEAIWFARQDDFLPLLERWLSSPGKTPPQDFDGLALRPSRAAAELLLRQAHPEMVSALRYLPTANIPLAIPRLIERLGEPNDTVRSWSFQWLSRWTGQRFGVDWRGFRLGRPTVEEGRSLQKEFRAWWQEHRAGFRPDR